MTYSRNRRDANEAELVAFWKQLGAVWVPGLPGCDGILLYRGKLHLVEVKMPKEREHLTQAERDLREKAAGQGIEYAVICTLDEAARLIGLDGAE
jgi:hypothetical protein